jgi:hypothetical protein
MRKIQTGNRGDNCIQNITRKTERERPLGRVIHITSNTSQGCRECMELIQLAENRIP